MEGTRGARKIQAESRDIEKRGLRSQVKCLRTHTRACFYFLFLFLIEHTPAIEKSKKKEEKFRRRLDRRPPPALLLLPASCFLSQNSTWQLVSTSSSCMVTESRLLAVKLACP